ncbi:hypothetical protein E2C01_082154 [Portunus trituberculatus]|uniref:Uncharacterized protein n=1 Tax=Portunus trituberculatus TaxID=210409 RepID=A0A5B7J016_PORTR|nr:hypothetical protein [Portunus trituberculatus]
MIKQKGPLRCHGFPNQVRELSSFLNEFRYRNVEVQKQDKEFQSLPSVEVKIYQGLLGTCKFLQNSLE